MSEFRYGVSAQGVVLVHRRGCQRWPRLTFDWSPPENRRTGDRACRLCLPDGLPTSTDQGELRTLRVQL